MKKTNIILILIILLQIVFKIYVDYNKEDFYIDEIYSYGLMNYKQAFIFEEPTFLENWHDQKYFDDYVTISEEDKYNFKPVIENQKEDFHPPFYYLLLRIASSFSIGRFTKWTGLILNLVIYVICSLVVFKIGKKIFGSEKYALLLVLLYGFSKFSTENTLFIRMYQLLELQILLLTNWFIENCYQSKVKNSSYIKLGIIIILGTLTQYYFMLFLITLIVLQIIRNIKKKSFKDIIKLLTVVVLSEIIIYMIFPAYTTQVKGNSKRSNQYAVSTIEIIKEKLNREKDYLEIVDNHMFNIKISEVLVVMAGIGCIIATSELIKNYKKRIKLKVNTRVNTILVPTLFYWTVVTLTSPYIDIRYLLPILVYMLILIIYILKKELEILIKDKKIVFITITIFSILISMTSLKDNKLEYQYKGNKELIENLRQYKEIPCIYMYGGFGVLQNGFLNDYNYIRQFDNVYIMNKMMFLPIKVEEVLEDKNLDNGIIFMEYEDKVDKETKMIIRQMDQFSNYEEIMQINNLVIYRIY